MKTRCLAAVRREPHAPTAPSEGPHGHLESTPACGCGSGVRRLRAHRGRLELARAVRRAAEQSTSGAVGNSRVRSPRLPAPRPPVQTATESTSQSSSEPEAPSGHVCAWEGVGHCGAEHLKLTLFCTELLLFRVMATPRDGGVPQLQLETLAKGRDELGVPRPAESARVGLLLCEASEQRVDVHRPRGSILSTRLLHGMRQQIAVLFMLLTPFQGDCKYLRWAAGAMRDARVEEEGQDEKDLDRAHRYAYPRHRHHGVLPVSHRRGQDG